MVIELEGPFEAIPPDSLILQTPGKGKRARRALNLLEEVPEREGELDQERGGLLPGEVLHEALQHQERLRHDVTVQGEAAIQHEGLEEAELSALGIDSCSGLRPRSCPTKERSRVPPLPPTRAFGHTGNRFLLLEPTLVQ